MEPFRVDVDVSRTRRSIRRRLDRSAGPLRVRKGIVTAVDYVALTATVSIGGDPYDELKFLQPYIPVVGDEVYVERTVDGDRVVIGPVAGYAAAPKWPNIMELSAFGTGQVGGNPPLEPWPPTGTLVFDWRKFYPDSQVLVDIQWEGYTHTANAQFYVGIRVDGNDLTWRLAYQNPAFQHTARRFAVRLSGIGAGLHTMMMVARGEGQFIQCDPEDRQTVIVQEINP